MCLPSRGMALRSRSATSGPGRAPASDSRARHGRGAGSARGPGRSLGPGRTGRLRGSRARGSAAETTAALRRRADALFDGAPRGGGDDPGSTGRLMPAGRGAPAAANAGAGLAAPRGLAGAQPADGPVAPASGAATRSALLDRPVARAEAPEADAVGAGDTRTREVRTREVPTRAGLALRERLPVWVQLRCGLEPRTLAALAVVLVAAAVFAVQHFWAGRPQPVRAPVLVQQGAATPAPQPSPGAQPAATGGAPEGRIVVDVSGKVRQPGIHLLPAGSRVADALRAAGGAREGTDLTALNRARVLMDGEQVMVGVTAPPGAPAVNGAGSGTGTGAGQPMGPMNLNSATVEQLETLPGVGPVLAQHIVDYRTEHGGFRSVDELREVDGIGERRFADLQTLVRP
ncbi:ComEA family DNA-binding protein [Streptomyces sp. NPDC051907]|uniref:ComEA family DNA-binding protein n=1 Tax=Streptomyces sp. NPDC051907 TaxID=3155284 RepID=UPI00342D3D20